MTPSSSGSLLGTGVPAGVADFLLSLIHRERAFAYLLIDSSMRLVEAGGNLGNYGLDSLEIGRPVCEQAVFLEGLLPTPATPLWLKSVQMSSGRAADLHLYSDHRGAWVLLLDVTAERDETWRLQQRAYEMTLLSEREAELIQRLEAANRTLQRTQLALEESREALLRAHRRLERELTEAANYVRSLLPPPLSEPFVTDWRFIPCTELGGDSFGYHWIDQDRFALYLLDVCGHGVGSALLSVAANSTLRSQALPNTDFCEPGEVLSALNQAFLMENNNDLYLTAWYGVYHRITRRLKYACAGHPPALLLRGDPRSVARIDQLRARGPVLGIASGVRYLSQECTVPASSRLFLLSDGTFEVRKPDGSMLEFSEFLDALAQPIAGNESELDRLLEFVRRMQGLQGPGPLEDDFSMVKFEF